MTIGYLNTIRIECSSFFAPFDLFKWEYSKRKSILPSVADFPAPNISVCNDDSFEWVADVDETRISVPFPAPRTLAHLSMLMVCVAALRLASAMVHEFLKWTRENYTNEDKTQTLHIEEDDFLSRSIRVLCAYNIFATIIQSYTINCHTIIIIIILFHIFNALFQFDIIAIPRDNWWRCGNNSTIEIRRLSFGTTRTIRFEYETRLCFASIEPCIV